MDFLKTLIIGLIFCTVIGCTASQETTVEEDSPTVITTNAPLYYFALQLAPNKADIHFPMRNEPDPAYWNPLADSIAFMQSADVILMNGSDYEGWAKNVTLPRSRIHNTTGDSENLILTEDAVTHSHGDEGEHAHGGYAFTTWMDLELAGQQVTHVKEALATLYPESQSLIEQRYKALAGEIQEIDQQYQESLDTSAFYVFSHPVYQYFQRRYNLKGQSMHWEPDETLSEEMLQEIEHLNEHYGIDYVVWEREPLAQTKTTLESLGFRCITIQPAGGLIENYDFVEIMKDNISNIKAARP